MKRVRVQQGMSLIEVLLAVALLATVVVVGAQALLVTVTGSDQLARESRTQLALTNFAETLRALTDADSGRDERQGERSSGMSTHRTSAPPS